MALAGTLIVVFHRVVELLVVIESVKQNVVGKCFRIIEECITCV